MISRTNNIIYILSGWFPNLKFKTEMAKIDVKTARRSNEPRDSRVARVPRVLPIIYYILLTARQHRY